MTDSYHNDVYVGFHGTLPSNNLKYVSLNLMMKSSLQCCSDYRQVETHLLEVFSKVNFISLFHRGVLQKACELNLSSVAVSVINSVKRNYPPDEGAHIALRKYIGQYIICVC